ncbi:hypothetical protein [Rheinheimera sp.]|uniref:hypothetical protein n=1 Tax=Rheinheimera sp. TaxID=1869214 RepID=UPI004048BB1A
MQDRQYDGVILEDKWGKTYLCSNCLFAYVDFGNSHLWEPKDAIYGNYFLHSLEPHWNLRDIWISMYRQARPWEFDLSIYSDFQLRDTLIQMFAKEEMWIWQLTEGWGKQPEGNGIGDGGLAPASSSAAAAPVTKAAKIKGGGVATEAPVAAKAASHEAKNNSEPDNRPTKTDDGQNIIYFEKSDIKCKELWGGQAYEFFIDGPDGPLEFAEANVDYDDSNIEFYINNNFNRGYVVKGNGFSITNEVLKRSVKLFEDKTGTPPVFMNGTIIKKNLQNFQKEFVNLRNQNPKTSDADIANQAVRKISFGAERIKIGYSDITTDIKRSGGVDVDGVTHKNVPTSIKITARKPVKNI